MRITGGYATLNGGGCAMLNGGGFDANTHAGARRRCRHANPQSTPANAPPPSPSVLQAFPASCRAPFVSPLVSPARHSGIGLLNGRLPNKIASFHRFISSIEIVG